VIFYIKKNSKKIRKAHLFEVTHSPYKYIATIQLHKIPAHLSQKCDIKNQGIPTASTNSTQNFTSAFSAVKTFKTVAMVTFFEPFSSFEIWDFCTPTN